MRRSRIAQFATMCAVAAALLTLLHRRPQPQEVRWSVTQGTIRDTTIFADHAIETKWGGQLTWKAEYKVGYSVANREYAVSTDSGIRGESESAVRLFLPESRPPCRVRYDSERPEVSFADCR
jgi:hypothetical protein